MKKISYIISLIFWGSYFLHAQQHPTLILTYEGVEQIRKGERAPLFERTLQQAEEYVKASMRSGIIVPIPKDMGGGYTHEQHKRNYKLMNLAGILFQIKRDTSYADFVKEMLFEYVEMYPSLPLHPSEKSYARGKLFWQCLNEANWLVYTSQAYDCIYDYLTEAERETLEQKLFRPFADFISIENPRFFNRIHNHSTWGNAAVGMMGIAMRDEKLVRRALYGLELSSKDLKAKDNDGGYIFEQGKSKAGFLAQIDHAFSPDGYYTEGPYYQRYAMIPFILFAQALDNYQSELKIFEYRNGLLLKAVDALLNQTSKSGEFFPINDAQKGMSIMAGSVVSIINIAFGQTGDLQLAHVAKQQNQVSLTQHGYMLAKALHKEQLEPKTMSSVLLRDGAAGQDGALAVLRSANSYGEITIPFKCTSQGLGHGHYDKLSISLYDEETEVLQDYGAARWVNIDQKDGGRYLKENTSWAKQTIAHNTLVVDQTSHFDGKYEIAQQNHSEIVSYDFEDKDLQIISAKEDNAYEDVGLRRTIILWKNESFFKPVVIDLTTAISKDSHQFDLPYHYAGQLLQTNVDYKINEAPSILGDGHGYQHVYQEGIGNINDNLLTFNWFKDRKFYTITALSDDGDEAILARIGANDPNFNLRRDPFLIHRKKDISNPIFLSIIEAHGIYNPVSEIPSSPFSQIKDLELIHHDKDYTLFSLTNLSDKKWAFMTYHGESVDKTSHKLKINNVLFEWKGLIHIIEQ